MGVFATCLWHLSLLALTSAALSITNHTIDDQAPAGVAYSPAGQRNTSLHGPTAFLNIISQDYNPEDLFNGTTSHFPSLDDASIDVDFIARPCISGNAIYVFAAIRTLSEDGNVIGEIAACRFILDGVSVGNYSTTTSRGAFDVSAYSNISIPDGEHTLRMVIYPNPHLNFFAFDYVVYKYVMIHYYEPECQVMWLSDGDHTFTSTSSTPSSSAAAASSVAAASTFKTKKKIIVGAVVEGITALLHLERVCFLPDRRRWKGPSDSEKSTRTAVADSSKSEEVSHSDAAPPGDILSPSVLDTVALAQELRTLKEEFNQFRQNAEGSSTAISETTSATRSLSTMKRDQTRALQDHGEGYSAADAPVHTDSGLRLMVGRRAVDELPAAAADLYGGLMCCTIRGLQEMALPQIKLVTTVMEQRRRSETAFSDLCTEAQAGSLTSPMHDSVANRRLEVQREPRHARPMSRRPLLLLYPPSPSR
ncbi:hypothetical protein DFH07DRAFT_1025394 [Mycena maculata]|uniref:Uncharacterized protein n=1 Tax=Mycena maculata TaxID=230809 RepID=A0AAD7NET9_9AGAR|nr:hypothetical protein DFH07DRAFT_1025394 [Mycena maculata]